MNNEFGHYLAAKRNGVKVEEFSIGFPPRLISFKKGETKFSFALLPLGGYVKLHGDNFESSEKITKSKAFFSKTPWVKIKILLAGVFMNFLVFVTLMTLAFTFGVQRNISSFQDFVKNVNESNVEVQHGLMIESIEDQSNQENLVGKKIYNNDSVFTIDGTNDSFSSLNDFKDAGITLSNFVELPTLKVLSSSGNVLVNDKILSVNDNYFYDFNSFISLFSENKSQLASVQVLRDNEILELDFDLLKGFYVSNVMDKSNAQLKGVKEGLVLQSIDEKPISEFADIKNYLSNNDAETFTYNFYNPIENSVVNLNLKPDEKGVTGMMLSPVYNYPIIGDSFALSSEYFTILNVNDIQYGFGEALIKSISSGFTMSWEIMKSFVSTFLNFFYSFELSESVGGPVAVFKMSYDYVSLGGTQLAQFIALISLTLAAINLIPIPVLDGGRIFIVIIEALRGKSLSNKTISIVSLLSFGLLLIFILFVSFFDIIRL